MTSTNFDNGLIHIHLCVERLGNCRSTLLSVKGHAGHPLAAPAFQYALVEYCTCFNTSRAADKTPRKLERRFVPAEHEALHDRMLAARDQTHAHADMSILDPSIEFRQFEGRVMTTTTMTYVDPLAEIRNLDEIVNLLECVQTNLFAEIRLRLDASPHRGAQA